MKKKIMRVEDLLEDSHKAEILELLGDTLGIEGAKVVIITGIPNEETGNLSMTVQQSGFTYVFEQLGFIQEGFDIVEDSTTRDDEESAKE